VTGVAGLSFEGSIAARFDGDDLLLTGTDILVSVDGFGALSGNFSVEKTGIGADAALLVGLDAVNADLGNIALTDGQMALYVAQNAAGGMGFALDAKGSGALQDVAGISMVADVHVRINTLQEAVDKSITLGNSTLPVVFDSADLVQELVIQNGMITVEGLGDISGAFAMVPTTETNAEGVTTRSLRIGLSDISGNLTPGGVGATLTGGAGALILERVTDANGDLLSSGYGLQAKGSVALTGIDGITLAADDLDIRYNRMGRAIENEQIETGGEVFVLNLLDNETRLSGTMTAEIKDVLAFGGQIFIESRSGVNAAELLLAEFRPPRSYPLILADPITDCMVIQRRPKPPTSVLMTKTRSTSSIIAPAVAVPTLADSPAPPRIN
jgi:hypothetical protein